MKEYDLLRLIAQIKKLPDVDMIRVLKNACIELDKRNKRKAVFLPGRRKKG